MGARHKGSNRGGEPRGRGGPGAKAAKTTKPAGAAAKTTHRPDTSASRTTKTTSKPAPVTPTARTIPAKTATSKPTSKPAEASPSRAPKTAVKPAGASPSRGTGPKLAAKPASSAAGSAPPKPAKAGSKPADATPPSKPAKPTSAAPSKPASPTGVLAAIEPDREVDLDVLLRAQQHALMLDEHDGLGTAKQCADFLARVGVALRYGPTASLPLASMYAAVRRSVPELEANAEAQRRATQLTHALLEDGTAIEINVIADRVGLAHADLVPALIALVRRGRAPDDLPLSDTARRVLAFLAEQPRPTAGQVRAHLGVPPGTWPNQADDALAELQRLMLVDRGATDVPATGAAYLAKEGIPYRLSDDVHRKHVRAAAKLDVPTAAKRLLRTYLGGAVFVRPAKLAGMWKRIMTDDDLRGAIDALVRDGHARLAGARGDILIAR